MATQSVQKDFQGPDWPLGCILVVTPGTPVNIMSLVDATNRNAPQTPTTVGGSVGEYTQRCNQITFQAYIPDTNGMKANTGNIYICRTGVQGAGNRDDYGSIIEVLTPGQTFSVGSSAQVKDVFSPYRYFIDADNAGDGALVTLFIF